MINENEVLEAISEAMIPKGDDAVTVSELVHQSGKPERVLRNIIRRLLRSGQVEVIKVHRYSMDGKLCKVPGYRKIKDVKKR